MFCLMEARVEEGNCGFQNGFGLMARKIRELILALERAGFINRGGKGSHKNYEHPGGARITLSGQVGDDAKPYQEREVRRTIQESEK
jgi:predicted RNA binding protein YcfA (HicA-like mRNA interferase family)